MEGLTQELDLVVALGAARPRTFGDDSLRPVARGRIDLAQAGVRFGAGDEERAGLVQSEQPLEIEVGPIHHVNRRRLWNQQIEHVDIVQLAVGNMDKAWNIATQIQKRVHLHGDLGAAKRCLGRQRQARINGGRVQRVCRVRQLQAQILPGVEPVRLGHQPLCELGEDASVPALVGIGQRRRRLMMRVDIQQEIQRSEESRYDHRLHGLLLITGDQSCGQVAELFGEDRRTVQRWVKTFEQRGLDGLRESPRARPPSPVADDATMAGVGAGSPQRPRRLRPDGASVWNGRLLSEHLRRHYDVRLGVRQCQRLFGRMGFRFRKPRP